MVGRNEKNWQMEGGNLHLFSGSGFWLRLWDFDTPEEEVGDEWRSSLGKEYKQTAVEATIFASAAGGLIAVGFLISFVDFPCGCWLISLYFICLRMRKGALLGTLTYRWYAQYKLIVISIYPTMRKTIFFSEDCKKDNPNGFLVIHADI